MADCKSFLGSLDEETLVGDRPNRILAPGRLGQPMSRRGSHLKDSLQKAAFRNMEWSSGVPPQKLLFFPGHSLQLHLCPFHLKTPPPGVAASV